MAKINILPKDIASLIAAGEVVERPASVVKELLENSVDAGATKVIVEIKNGGVRYIRITDNGCGIARDDIRAAFISHATSKIKIQEDLDAIMTLGFRGEALASVAAVAHVEVMTRTSEEETGTRYIISGGTEEYLDDAGCPVGTTMMIRDIFYNTPARMKFLKKDITEGNYISDAVNKIALSHPEVSFSLIKDNKRTLFTPGDGRLLSVITEVYGSSFASGLIECKGETDGVKVYGYISKPVHSRPNRSMQHFFVNGRYVRIPAASSALDNAYKNQIMVGKYPAAVLFIEVNPQTVDVNVHPAKTQVRFSNERPVYDSIYFAAVDALAAKDTPVVVKPEIRKQPVNIFAAPKKPVEQVEMQTVQPERAVLRIDEPEVKKTPVIGDVYGNVKAGNNYKIPTKTIIRQPEVPFFRNDEEDEETVLNMRPEKASEPVKENDTVEVVHPPSAEKNENVNFRIIGEAFKTYIIAEQEGKLLYIDKHAAHERIIFNSLKKRKKNVYPQLLLVPVNVTLSAKDYNSVIGNIEIFRKAGFDIEDFGEGTIRVRECPEELSDGDVEAVVLEMADKLSKNSKEPESEKEDWLYHSTACRAAVKAGDNITMPEMELLVRTVLTDNDVRYCPHGRPVMFVMTEYDIKKLFGRNG